MSNNHRISYFVAGMDKSASRINGKEWIFIQSDKYETSLYFDDFDVSFSSILSLTNNMNWMC